ncbi:MAG: hypothetical protein J6X55_17145 [Victivallales bacterium]|nr:hypothetical protein [Victivallales bacterium]
MDLNDEILAALKGGDLSEIRTVIIGCLDEDMSSSGKPQTLAMADAIAEKMTEKLFEVDNGHFDFSLPKTKDTLRSIKSRLRMNFSREKLAFACEIIGELNQESSSASAVTSTTQATQTVVAAATSATPATSTSDKAEKHVESVSSAPIEEKITNTVAEVSTQDSVAKTSTAPKSSVAPTTVEQKTETPSVEWPKANEVQMPETPQAQDASSPSLSGTLHEEFTQSTQNETTPKASSSSLGDSEKATQKGQQPNEPKKAPGETRNQQTRTQQGGSSSSQSRVTMARQIGFWEKLFGSVGRRIDEFLARLKG